MLIQPFIVNDREETVLLSHRELRLASNKYGVVRYKRKLYYITTDLQVVLDGQLPPQIGSIFLKDDDKLPELKPSQGYVLETGLEKLNFPTVKFLSKIAFDGIDEGFLALKMLRTFNLSAQESFKNALTYRPRYKTLNNSLHFSDIKTRLVKVLLPDQNFQSVVHRYFSYPYNNHQYLTTTRDLPNFKLSDYLDNKLSGNTIEIINRKSINDYFLANILFHHSIYLERLIDNSENDILNYDEENNNGMSKECQRVVRSWRSSTLDELFHLCAELPLRMMKNGRRLSLLDPDYPIFIKNLSIYSIAPITYNTSVVARLSKLHKSGIRKVGHISYLYQT